MYKIIKGFLRLPSHVTNKKISLNFKGVSAKANPANLKVWKGHNLVKDLNFKRSYFLQERTKKLSGGLLVDSAFQNLTQLGLNFNLYTLLSLSPTFLEIAF